jgi:hypothetical protein
MPKPFQQPKQPNAPNRLEACSRLEPCGQQTAAGAGSAGGRCGAEPGSCRATADLPILHGTVPDQGLPAPVRSGHAPTATFPLCQLLWRPAWDGRRVADRRPDSTRSGPTCRRSCPIGAAGLLEHLLPVDAGIHCETVRRRRWRLRSRPSPSPCTPPSSAAVRRASGIWKSASSTSRRRTEPARFSLRSPEPTHRSGRRPPAPGPLRCPQRQTRPRLPPALQRSS